MKKNAYDINSKIYYFLLYLFAFLTILDCNSVYHGMSLGKFIGASWQILLFGFFIYSLIRIPQKYLHSLFTLSSLLILLNFTFLMLDHIHYDFGLFHPIMIYVLDPVMLLPCFLSFYVSNNETKFSFFKAFNNIVLILAVVSLFFWIIGLMGAKPNMSIMINWGHMHSVPGYFGIDFFSQGNVPFLGFSNIIRNTGIFSEAPMYSYILSISLLIELFIKDTKLSSYKVIILIITIISTTSTTGILAMIPALLFKESLTSNNIYVKISSLLCIPIIIIIFKSIFSAKVGDINNQVSSYNERRDNILASFYAWKQHLFIGNGINNVDAVLQNDYSSFLFPFVRKPAGGSGFMTVLAQGGIFYALLYIIPSLIYSSKSLRKFLFALFTFILMIFTIIQDSYIYIIILSYFWTYLLLNHNNNSELD